MFRVWFQVFYFGKQLHVKLVPEFEELSQGNGSSVVLVHFVVGGRNFNLSDFANRLKLVHRIEDALSLCLCEAKVLLPGEHEFIGHDVSIAVEVKQEEKPLHFDQSHRVVFGVVVSRVEEQLTRVFSQSIANGQKCECYQRIQSRCRVHDSVRKRVRENKKKK